MRGSGAASRPGRPDEIAVEESVNTYKGVERIVRAAFEHADRTSRGRVTLVDKANVLSYEGGTLAACLRRGRRGISGDRAGRDVRRRDGDGSGAPGHSATRWW